jgi:hypothetical protein
MKIHANLIVLQEEMSKLDKSNMNESAFASLSGLKQVSSIASFSHVPSFNDEISYIISFSTDKRSAQSFF